MAFWNRNKQSDNSELPEEVREYYKSTKRSRLNTPWLLGLGTLLLTLFIAVILYFGGKFVYNQFFVDDTPEAPVATETTTQETESQDNSSQSNENSVETPATLPGDGNEQSAQDEEVSTNSTNSTAGNGLSETPDTGPGDVVAIFVATTILATLLYELRAYKKTS